MYPKLTHLFLSLLGLAASLSSQTPIARFARDLSHNFRIDPNFIALAASDAGNLYAGSPHFLISQYNYPEHRQDFAPKNLMALPAKGIHIKDLKLQVATNADGTDLLAVHATHAIQDQSRGGPVTSGFYQFSNESSQPVVELCTVPARADWHYVKSNMVLDGKRQRLFYDYRASQSHQFNIVSLVMMRNETTGLPAPCPSRTIDLPPSYYGDMIYDDSRDILLLSFIRTSICSLQIVNGTTGAMLGVVVLNELSNIPQDMKLDTARSILYCHMRNWDHNSDVIYAYDLSDLNAVKLANVYPFPHPFRISQMEVDNKLGVLHVTSQGQQETTPWHWSAIASDRHAMVMNITVFNIDVNRFVLHNSEIGFYGKRIDSWNNGPCFHRFAFEYDKANAIGSAQESVNLGVVF